MWFYGFFHAGWTILLLNFFLKSMTFISLPWFQFADKGILEVFFWKSSWIISIGMMPVKRFEQHFKRISWHLKVYKKAPINTLIIFNSQFRSLLFLSQSILQYGTRPTNLEYNNIHWCWLSKVLFNDFFILNFENFNTNIL